MDANHSKMEQLSYEFRGQILHDMTWLEKVMDIYISQFFCSSKQRGQDMHLFILGDNRMSLDSKKQVFVAIANKYDSEWFKGFDNFSSRLSKIIEQRNIFAHLLINTETQMVKNFDGSLQFLRFKNDVKPFEYNLNDIAGLRFEIKDIHNYIYKRLKKDLI